MEQYITDEQNALDLLLNRIYMRSIANRQRLGYNGIII